jgi:uncharacterized protein (TIGR03086 family)
VNVISALERSYDQTTKLVAGLTPGQLDAPTFRAGWDVRATLNHMLGATWMFTLVNQGHAAEQHAGDVIGDDASLAVTAAAKENLASWRQPGAFEGDRSYFFGTFPATGAAMLNLEEVVVHNWDVAMATDQELVIDPALGQLIYDGGASIPLGDFRDHDHDSHGPEVAVPASVSIVDRLVGLLGRQL